MNKFSVLSKNIEDWAKDYKYDAIKNDFVHNNAKPIEVLLVNGWFEK